MPVPRALIRLPLERLERHLENEPTDEQSIAAYHQLFSTRTDSGQDLIRFAPRTTNRHAGGVALVTGILRCAAAGQPIEPTVDARFGSDKYVEEHWSLMSPWAGLEPALAALAALGVERALKIVRRLFGADYTRPLGWLFLHQLPDDEALLTQAFSGLSTWKFPTPEIAMGISLFPAERLVELHGLASQIPRGTQGANLASLGLQALLMRAAVRQEVWDRSADSLLGVHEIWPGADFMFAAYAAPVLRAAVAGLSGERALAWLAAQAADPLAPTFSRVILAVPPKEDAVVRRLLVLLDANAQALRKPAFDWLTELARLLGPSASAHLEALSGKKLRSSFQAGIAGSDASDAPTSRARAARKTSGPKKSAAVARVERLAGGAGPSISILALEAVAGATPGAVSHVGGPGFDLGERQPKIDGLPMAHVFTLSVDDVPELEECFSGAKAVALYLSGIRSNEAFAPYTEEAAVVPVTDADIACGFARAAAHDLPLKRLRVTAIAIPANTFDHPSGHPGLLKAIASLPGRAAGAPDWLQEPEEAGRFILQFTRKLAPVNLGDDGVMYVFAETAFWQSR